MFNVGSFRNVSPGQKIQIKVENNYIESTNTGDQFTAFINVGDRIFNFGEQDWLQLNT